MDWFEKIFKFKSINFTQGDIALQAGQMIFAFIVLILFLLIGFFIVYTLTNIYTSNRSKALSLGLRIPALLLLCLPLFEPVLIMPDIIPDENFIAVLIDNSESMSIDDGHFSGTRASDVNQILLGEENGILPELEELFKVRYYAFSDKAMRIDSISYATFDGNETNITSTLERVISDFKGLPLSGIVLLTDGGDNSKEVPLNMAEELRNLDIPLHIVGLGKESFEQEREILDVTTNENLEEGTGAEIEVKVRSWSEKEGLVNFDIYKGEELVFSKKKRLKGNGKIDHLTFFYEPDEKGAIEYTLKISESPKEVNIENNSLNMLIDTQKDTIRVLYFEGHLRKDFKFIKRALEDDQVLEFISVSRTGTGKYYRQGIKSASELSGGFTATEKELYRYKVIIFGDLEASYFSIEQLKMIENFVRIRGGGFLMLGGSNSFAEGDYWNTPISDILPVGLDPGRKMVIQPEFYDPDFPAKDQGFVFAPTRAGLENPILKLSPDFSTNRRLWNNMPRLTTINYLGDVKPGATVLAVKPKDKYGESEPLLVTQRYGKGQTAVFTTASTWRWQMLLDHQDKRHERFWRQFARWLAASAMDHVNIQLAENRFAPNEEIPIRVTVYDDDYNPMNFVDVNGTITDPFGTVLDIAFQPELTEEGEYVSTFIPQKQGVYKIHVDAETNGRSIGEHYHSFLARPSKKEFYNATLKREFLKNLANTSGGVYYMPQDASDIPPNLKSRKTSTSIYRAEYLWDMPLIFLLVLILLSVEWIYRRRKGLP